MSARLWWCIGGMGFGLQGMGMSGSRLGYVPDFAAGMMAGAGWALWLVGFIGVLVVAQNRHALAH